MVEALEDSDPGGPGWLAQARKLSAKVHHRLQEEEPKFSRTAGKLLDAQQKRQWAGAGDGD